MTPTVVLAAATVILVVDGDTIKYDGTRHRFIGCDAPEILKPQCDRERQLGINAAARLIQLLGQAERREIEYGARTAFDFWRRPKVNLILDGEDVCETLIREGHAVRYRPRKRHDWCR